MRARTVSITLSGAKIWAVDQRGRVLAASERGIDAGAIDEDVGPYVENTTTRKKYRLSADK